MQSASIEGKQNRPSNGATVARNSCGATMRRLESNCFSNVEMNTSPAQPDQVRRRRSCRNRRPPHPTPFANPLANEQSAYGDVIGLTRDELGHNDTDYHSWVESERIRRVE